MTTSRDFAPPVLDRLLQREVTSTVEVPASAVYAYDEQELGSSDNLDAGRWRRNSDTGLSIALEDSSGLTFPTDLVIPASDVEVAWDGAAATTLTITALAIVRDPLSFVPLSIRLTFDPALPAAGAALAIGIQTDGTQTVTQTVTRPVWAARRPFLGRDLLRITDGSIFSLQDVRFIVRSEGPALDEGDTFTDDEGVTRTVRGVAQIGRSRHLELLGRAVG